MSTMVTWEQLLSRAEETHEGCLVWLGAKDRHGYGVVRRNNKNYLIHRLAWIINFGQPTKDFPLVLHRCDNPPCFALEHLFLGTHADNSRDMAKKGRVGGQGVTSCPRGHPYVDGSWYGTRWARTCKQCAKARSKERYRASKR